MNLLKSLISVSIMTLISRVLGFFRDVLIANTFGTSMFTDAFFIAFKISNFLRCIFSEGVFCQSFVPVLMKYKTQKNGKCIKNFISSVLSLMILILIIITVLGIVWSRYLILISAPGFAKSPDLLKVSVHLLQIMFPYIFFVSLSSFFSSILNSWGYFSIPAFSPCLLNISIIIFSIFFSSYYSPRIISLAWSVTIGGCFQLFYQCLYLYKINMLVIPKINFKNIGLLRVLKKIVPSILGSSANQISLIFNNIFISLLNFGSVSWMYYADRLIEFPIGILGVSLSTVLFSFFSKSYYINKSEFKSLLNSGLKIGLIFSLPSSVILFFLSKPLVIVLFKHGKFTDFDVLMIHKILEAYSFGLVSFILIKILSSAFYSFEEIKIPVNISIFTLFLTQAMNPILIFYFQQVGLALSISISGWMNFFFLFWKLNQKKLICFKYKDLIFFVRLIFSILTMIFFLFFTLNFMPSWEVGSFFYKLVRLLFVLFISGASYLISLYFLGIRLLNFSCLSLKIK
ncbi:murein biosynthesis integral membrane protein MurJ [Buchnera aphidicola (Muscaphis stroyani)]|uniref:Probable lipid II flippase MurJ n=1 Tax=Buchnera aphidicola (Muscaphis stroyani) TaxID=1241869 RepID=A0A4D6YFI2_9GAMM|nr:murein biosynthesis integral membrane protein MurJ [Buchnera aphidicola]QCI24400.1 murein biosynthesis integral membrane protein MurJ [Buchnera aphidicola (Muscaphis stroyani)]